MRDISCEGIGRSVAQLCVEANRHLPARVRTLLEKAREAEPFAPALDTLSLICQNADIAAAHIAAKLNAKKLILMTDIRGLLRDRNDESTLIPVVNVSSVPKLQHDGIISGGMIPKIQCCVEAVRRGVSRAHIIDGRIAHSILIELLTNEGIGTMLY